VVDNTSSDDVAALYPTFLSGGLSVVTPNKKAYSSSLELYKKIIAASEAADTKYLNEATVGAGLPIIQTLKDLVQTGDKAWLPTLIRVLTTCPHQFFFLSRFRQIIKIEGVFSGTLSYIFNEFSPVSGAERSFSSVVRVAKEEGYTEPHPADDLSGADVARKLTILSRLIPELANNLPEGYKSVSITSLIPQKLQNEGLGANGDEFVERLKAFDGEYEALQRDAVSSGNVLRFVGVIDVPQGIIKAALQPCVYLSILYSTHLSTAKLIMSTRYPRTHPFATSLSGSDNIIAFHTERYGARPLIVQGAGAGAAVTAMGVLSDLFKL